jgi:para-nitrobenzyl esterase
MHEHTVRVEINAERRDRITSAYPGYPASSACVQLGGDFAFGAAAWQVAEAHGRHASTYVYRYDYAPRTLRWSGLGATHATELLAVFDTYRTRFGSLLTAAADRRSARKVMPTADWPGKVSRWPHGKRRVIRGMPAQRPRM